MLDLFPCQKLPRGLESRSRSVLDFRVSRFVLPDGPGSAWVLGGPSLNPGSALSLPCDLGQSTQPVGGPHGHETWPPGEFGRTA